MRSRARPEVEADAVEVVASFWFSSFATGSPNTTAPPWCKALVDPEIGRALRLIHGDPSRSWTVHSLAAMVGLSRATFARRFVTLVREPPLTYLTRWRMTVAAGLLRDTDLRVAAVAGRVGYHNEFAFTSAFKRILGEAPTRYRASYHLGIEASGQSEWPTEDGADPIPAGRLAR